MSVQLTPHFGNVQAHYDLSDDFFASPEILEQHCAEFLS